MPLFITYQVWDPITELGWGFQRQPVNRCWLSGWIAMKRQPAKDLQKLQPPHLMKIRDIIFKGKKRRPWEPLTMGLDLLAIVSEAVFLQGSMPEGGATQRGSLHEHGLDDYQPFASGSLMLQFLTDSLVSLYKLIVMFLEFLWLVDPNVCFFFSVETYLLFAVSYTRINRLFFYVMLDIICGALEMVNKK